MQMVKFNLNRLHRANRFWTKEPTETSAFKSHNIRVSTVNF